MTNKLLQSSTFTSSNAKLPEMTLESLKEATELLNKASEQIEKNETRMAILAMQLKVKDKAEYDKLPEDIKMECEMAIKKFAEKQRKPLQFPERPLYNQPFPIKIQYKL